MWKLYSENGKGICLKFRSDKIEKTMIPSAQKPYEYIRLSACKYERDNNLSKQYTRLKKIYLNGAFEKDYWRNLEEFNNFKLHCALLKDASYKFEQEYRLVKAAQEYSFRPSVDGFIPYTEIKLPLSCLVEIIIRKTIFPLSLKRNDCDLRSKRQNETDIICLKT